MRADGPDDRLVHDGEMVAAQLNDLQLINDSGPSAVGVNPREARLELDRTVVHALRAEQQHRHLNVGPAPQIDLVQDAVVDEAGALVLEDTGGQSVLGGVGVGEELSHHRQQGFLPCALEEIEGHREIETVGLLGERLVALPPCLGLLHRVRHRFGGLHGVEEHDLLDLDVGADELVCDLVGQSAAEAPAAEDHGPAVGVAADLVDVRGGPFLEGTLAALDAVNGDILRQATHQRLVHHRRTAGRVEHEHGGLLGALHAGPQDADVALDLGLEPLAHGIGQRFEGLCPTDLRGGDLRAGALGEALRDRGGGLLVDLGEFTGHTGSSSTRQCRPGGEDQPLGRVAGCDTDALPLGVRRRLRGRRGCLGGGLRFSGGGVAVRDELLDQDDDVGDGRVTQGLDL